VKYRVAMWASAGFLVACFWALYFLSFPMSQIPPAEPMWMVVRLTCPIAFLTSYSYHIKIYWTLLANATTYALVGLTVETLRRQLQHAG
jgi:hypothetical protein